MRHLDKHVAGYEASVYPNGWPAVRRDPDWSDSEQRKAWLTLFLLASCHTLGRARFEQNREFVRLCDRERILDSLAEVDRNPASWLIEVERYATAQAEWTRYFHWMRLFIGTFLVARKLSDYGDAFLESRFDRPFSISDIISPNTSSIADFFGPSLRRVLGIGACFMMRELARKGINDNQHLFPHCYVPHGRVRRLLAVLGCPGMTDREVDPDVFSRQIHTFLCDPRNGLGPEKGTFGSCFDLPFLILAYSRRRHKLHERLFGRELSLEQSPSGDGDFVTLSDGRVIPRWYMGR
jgi:hypothetical protein